MGKRMKAPRVPRVRDVAYRLVDATSPVGKELYATMGDLIESFHEDLSSARIAIAWNLKWKPDVDGRVMLGKLKKASELDRELAPYDFVMVLRQEFFQDSQVKDEQKRALIDHELSHGAPALDKDGEQKEDGRGRKMWRIRKHDLEEFSEVVARHGMYKRDIELFASALKRGPKQSEMFDPARQPVPATPSTEQTTRH